MKGIALLLLVGCGSHPDVIEPVDQPLAAHHEVLLDTTPKQQRRMMQPEVFLRAYLGWFGGLAPIEVQQRAHGGNLFDEWRDYLAALGLPDYKLDTPRSTQSNTMMLAAIDKLSEALCVRAVEHDLAANPPLDQRLIFVFEERAGMTLDEFAPRFDVLHRLFLSYPAALAPGDRTKQFFELFQHVAARHREGGRLSPERMGWVAVCAALVQHPETELY